MPILIKNYMKIVPSVLMCLTVVTIIPCLQSMSNHIRFDHNPKQMAKSNGFQKALRLMDNRNKYVRDRMLHYQPHNQEKTLGLGTSGN